MAKKKQSSIPMVDALRAGIDPDIDPYQGMRGDSGRILLTPSSKLQKVREKEFRKHIEAEEERLNKLKSMTGVKTSKPDEPEKQKKRDSFSSDDMFSTDTLSIFGSKRKFDDEDEYERVDKKKKKKDKKKKKKDKRKKNKESGKIEKVKLTGLTVKEKINKKTGEKKEISVQDQIAARFKDVEKMTQDNIKTIDETIKIVDDRLIKLTAEDAGRIRGQETAISNYIQAKSTLINARQSAAKDILQVRTKAIDIELKKEAKAGVEATDTNALIAKLLPEMIGNKALKAGVADTISKNGKNKDKKHKKRNLPVDGYNDDESDDQLSKRLKRLQDDGDLEYNKYDKHIQYENQFTTAIKKSWKDGDWKFIALDNSGNTMDVPKSVFPSKKTCDIQFDDEKDIAVDRNRGISYRVIQVPSL